jgi:hypothetical protein
MEELAKLEYPKPNREFVYGTFNDFARIHPWVGQENIRPKSVAREMYETYQSFDEYVKEYGLERAEGLLLRYVSDVYKALVQTVPAWAKTDATAEMTTYFGQLVRGVDSSLLDEWERMQHPEDFLPQVLEGEKITPKAPPDLTKDRKAFTVLVRNALFRFLRALASRDYAAAATMVEGEGEAWTPERLEQALAPFYAEHASIRTDPVARSPVNTRIERHEAKWEVQQVIADDAEDNDWYLDCEVDLERSRAAWAPVVVLRRVAS